MLPHLLITLKFMKITGNGQEILYIQSLEKSVIQGVCHCRIGSPLVLQVPRDTTFMDLQKDLLLNMATSLRPGIMTQVRGRFLFISFS